MIDTGAAVSLVRRDVWEQIVKGDCTLVLEQWAGRRLVGVNGAPLSVSGCKKVDIFLNGMPFKVMCVVTDDIMVEAILGLDFVNAHNGIIDCGSKRLTFPSRNISVPLQMQSCPLQQNPIGLIVKEKIVIPAASEVELMVDLATPVAKGTWVVTGNTSARHGVMVAHAVVCPNAKPVPVRVVNPREEIVVLKKGTEIAHMELLEQDPVIEISTVAEKFNISREDQSLLWEMVSRVGDDVNKDEKEELFSKPLHRLTEKNVPFDWTIHCQNAFDELRKCLVSSPILAYPDYNRRYILDTDASDTGIGAVLSQISDEGSERVIAYASRSLSRPEQRYCVTRKELLAVVSFVQQFRQYLLGREFTLRTDHGSLVWIRNFKEPEGQLARWLEKLQEYNFTVVHRQGSRHCNADALSRVPCRQCGRENQNVETSQGDNAVITGIGAVLSPFQTCTPNEMRKLQLQDEAIGPVYRAVLDRKTPSADVSKSWSWESRVLMQHWGSLNIQNGVLWRKCIDKCRDYLQLVLPAKLQVDTLRDLHEGAIGGHLGEEKMLNKLKERFYWPGCTEAVKDWCRTCIRCTTRKTAAPKRKAPLQSLRAGYPMQIVCVDIMGPLPETEDGCKYVLVASDCFTRWVEVYGIPNQEATTVAKKLVDEMFCRFSPPEQLHSDQGRQFESELVKEICVLLQIRKTHTTPYHPQCNGMVERFNRTLLDMLATTIDNHQADWQHHIRKLCLAYNSSIHSTTGFSPFFLMFGRQVKLPIDLMYGTNRTGPDTAAGFAQKLKEGLQEAYKLVREKCQAEHKRQKALYDERVHGKPFSPGDLVWLHSPAVPRGRSRKLHHPWKGPLKVVERLGESNYKIKSLQGRKKTQIVHFDRLKPCVASTAEDRQNSRPPTTPETQIDRQPTGKYVELLDSYDDEPVAEEPATDAAPPPPQEINIQPRYPVRNRHPPDRYGAYVEH